MREIIAICRSEKASRDRVARILDRYFWRIGDRTWRGQATNACLDRVSRELRKRATRNTAVVIHEIRSSAESRIPIIRIGSRHAFSESGLVPVSSHPSDFKKLSTREPHSETGSALISIAALFHDLGKAANMFQNKIREALKGHKGQADAIRHELISAAVWDELFGVCTNEQIIAQLAEITGTTIDNACTNVVKKLTELHSQTQSTLDFRFLGDPTSFAYVVGLLILTHHRLPEGDNDHKTLLACRHIQRDKPLNAPIDLSIAHGTPFWHEEWWIESLKLKSAKLQSVSLASADIALRASLMLADHFGSSQKAKSSVVPDHIANTIVEQETPKPIAADSLSRHVKRVYRYTRHAFEALHKHRERYPAIDASKLPPDIAFPETSKSSRFAWQAEAAHTARKICETNQGGFFAAILAGTGTGKTRGAPTILASAAMGDTIPERRYFRMSLGLGLRVLATQSAKEYVNDLGFANSDVSVLIGDPPLDFENSSDDDPLSDQGSESLITLPDWLRAETVEGPVPKPGDQKEDQWLRSLSLNTDQGIPAFIERIIEASSNAKASGKRMIQAPILVGTVDHLMGVAAPVNSRFLLQSVRLMTSDLILDEIDQYDGEDLAAIARLVFQAAAAGRRVVIMSATLTPDIAEAFHSAYAAGWSDYAKAFGMVDHVNLLICGDAPGSVFSNADGDDLGSLLFKCRQKIIQGIKSASPLRRAQILLPCDDWTQLVDQVHESASRLHDLNAVSIDSYRVSVGMVRMTRIAHTAALASQIPSGALDDRLRLIVCLHSQMPRLHRAYIETCLKRALTRKDQNDPNNGIRSLCQAQKVFAQADQANKKEIEIVIITTPVIETGNDVDFDWAIIDPISTRSIIQSAGRVCRHRSATGDHVNVYILGRSPVAMQTGELSRPGVETRPSPETKVARQSLKDFTERHFAELAGQVTFDTITSEPILRDDLTFPLRDAEASLRSTMLSLDPKAPLGLYISCPNARWNLAMTRSRKFRRSDNMQDVEFVKLGDDIKEAQWFIDLAPGTRHSTLRQATQTELNIPQNDEAAQLFKNMTKDAWHELSGTTREMTYTDIKTLLRARISNFGNDIEHPMTYTDFTGFTSGSPDDLLKPFGKA